MGVRKRAGAKPTRREVIKTSVAAGVVAGVDALIRPGRAQTVKPPHVVIVGAGLAGLSAAYRLQETGWTYTILEAERNHVGGRVRTVRFNNGTYGEFGAMRIPEKHKLTLQYVDDFGLDRRRFVMNNPAAYYYARGRRARRADIAAVRSQYRLIGAEARKTPDDLWNAAVANRIKKLRAPEKKELSEANAFKTKKINELDRLSLLRAAELAGLSDEAIEFLFVTYGVGTLQHGALTEHLREELHEIWTRKFYEIVDGTDRLPRAFVDALQVPPQMGCEVVRLEQDEKRATAIYREAGGQERSAHGDFLLCTIPLPVLARLEVDPPFSGAKQRAIRDVAYEAAIKVLVPTAARFWETEDQIYGGGSFTDSMSGPIFYPSDNAQYIDGTDATGPIDAEKSRGPGMLVASYTWGQEARRLGNMQASQREALTIELVSKVHPQLKSDVVLRNEVRSWAWDNYRWAGGAFAFYMPGQFASLHRHLLAPEKRIFLAGEHCSRNHSWMEGALESSRDAVKAIVARSK